MDPRDQIKKPCPMRWDDLQGEGRRRFCASCSCHVHDLNGMSQGEIGALQESLGGKLCGAFPAATVAMGTAVASLALASCKPLQPEVIGDYCPPAEEVSNPEILGRISGPIHPAPPVENPSE